MADGGPQNSTIRYPWRVLAEQRVRRLVLTRLLGSLPLDELQAELLGYGGMDDVILREAEAEATERALLALHLQYRAAVMDRVLRSFKLPHIAPSHPTLRPPVIELMDISPSTRRLWYRRGLDQLAVVLGDRVPDPYGRVSAPRHRSVLNLRSQVARPPRHAFPLKDPVLAQCQQRLNAYFDHVWEWTRPALRRADVVDWSWWPAADAIVHGRLPNESYDGSVIFTVQQMERLRDLLPGVEGAEALQRMQEIRKLWDALTVPEREFVARHYGQKESLANVMKALRGDPTLAKYRVPTSVPTAHRWQTRILQKAAALWESNP